MASFKFFIGTCPKDTCSKNHICLQVYWESTALKDATTSAFQNLQEIWKSCSFIYDTKLYYLIVNNGMIGLVQLVCSHLACCHRVDNSIQKEFCFDFLWQSALEAFMQQNFVAFPRFVPRHNLMRSDLVLI